MFNCCWFLLIPGFFPAQALRIPGSALQTTPISIVAGTNMLDEAETHGHRPLFIDAFYDHAKPEAHVILNMKSFLEPSKQAIEEWGSGTQWSCEWTDAPDVDSSEAGLGKVMGKVPGHTNLDAIASQVPTFSFPSQGDDYRPNASVEASFKQSKYHWAIVISCPTMPTLSKWSSPRLNLIGERNGQVTYDRFGIPVSETRFVKHQSFALCTMVVRSKLTEAEYLMPWAQYHLAAGFTQLLIYIEEYDIAWAEEALRNFIEKGQVTIVPFYFGKVSAKRKFLTQGAMENHCVYQARGRAKWMAHTDIDEYFDFIGPYWDMRNQQLPELRSSDAALIVRSQFWGPTEQGFHRADSPFPCNINGKNDNYFKPHFRSKVILRPELILALFPHYVVMEAGSTEVYPDPETELRLNHFKLCETTGHGCTGKPLLPDPHNFTNRCEAMLARRAVN